MIAIDKYEIINNEDGSQVFKIDYTNRTNDLIRLKIEVQDLLFKTTSYEMDYHDVMKNLLPYLIN